MNDEPRDTWEDGGLTVPAIAWGKRAVGDGFDDAVLLPCPRPGKYFGKGYEIVYDMEPAQVRDSKNKMVDNPNFGQPKRWPPKGNNPVGEPKTQTVLWLSVPGFSSIELMSTPQIEKFTIATQGGDPDDLAFIAKVKRYGLRRLFITGGSLEPEAKKIIRPTTKMPKVAATIGVRISKFDPNDYGGETKIFTVKYAAPTTATLDTVNTYLKDPVVIEGGSEVDPWGEHQDAAPPPANMNRIPATVPAAPTEDEETPF